MNNVIDILTKELDERKLLFEKKPIIIGGMAKEYYGIRKTGLDIDLIICDEDYNRISEKYPVNRKDIWGDFGIVIEPFEMWRCIHLLDYSFFVENAIDENIAYVVSLEKLMIMCIFGKRNPKIDKDLELLGQYFYKYRNKSYIEEADKHLDSYKNNKDGIIYGGKYNYN